MGFLADVFTGGAKKKPEPRVAPRPGAAPPAAAKVDTRRRRGRAGTVLTGPQGAPGAAPTEKKTLLGA